jgi:hypothetical protein
VANWIVTPESGRSPMVSVGTSSDRIFSPPGYQSYYATFAKSLPGVTPYVSLFYSEWERGWLFPFGANIRLSDRWELQPMHDGRNTHLLLNHRMETMHISAMLIKMRYPGVSVGFAF